MSKRHTEVKAYEVKAGDELSGGWANHFEVTAVSEEGGYNDTSPRVVKIRARGVTGEREGEFTTVTVRADKIVPIYRTPPSPQDEVDKIIADAEILKALCGAETRRALELIIQLARMFRDHHHTDGPGVNPTSGPRLGIDFSKDFPPGVYC